MRRCAHGNVSPSRTQAGPRRGLLPRGRDCTGCAANSPKPRKPTGRPASGSATPQPGFALLRLAQGQIDAAHAAIRQVAERGAGQPAAGRACSMRIVEIVLAANDVGGGPRRRRRAVRDRRPACDAPLLDAVSARADGRRAARRSATLAEPSPPCGRSLPTVARTRGAVRGGARPRPDRARVPDAGRRSHRGAGTGCGARCLSSSWAPLPIVARVEALRWADAPRPQDR